MRQWIKQHKNLVIGGAIIIVVLAAAFLWGGSHSAPSSQPEQGAGTSAEQTVDQASSESGKPAGSGSDTTGENTTESLSEQTVSANGSETEQNITTAITESTTTATSTSTTTTEGTTAATTTSATITTATSTSASTVASTDATTTEEAVTFQCTITISCANLLNHMDRLDPAKTGLVPASGVILATTTVTVTEGESVYDVLRRSCMNAGIPLDASYSPAYGTAYVRGINNLYEFDCGNLSGWKYCVNGVYPNIGCSSYILKSGDAIQWNYTCDMNDL